MQQTTCAAGVWVISGCAERTASAANKAAAGVIHGKDGSNQTKRMARRVPTLLPVAASSRPLALRCFGHSEHSSARLERFMQLCAEMNMEVCVPTTAAQVFHMLRRQGVRMQRKPLVVMSPKSLLRHKDAASSLEELANGEFKRVIGEVDELDAKKVKRVVLCCGNDDDAGEEQLFLVTAVAGHRLMILSERLA